MKNHLTVTILGSGTCLPSLRRSACAVLMETAGVKAVFDCGPGTMGRLLQAGVTVFEVTHLFLSHFHPDHTGEMPSFVFANKYAPAAPRTRPLVLAGGRGLIDFYAGLKSVYGHWIDLGPDLMVLKEFSTQGRDDCQSGHCKLVTRPVAHRPESIGFRVTVGETTVVYSGDTDVSPELVELSRDADLLICESAWPDGLKKEGHLTPSLAGAIAREAGVKRLILTHLYPECDKVDIRRQCAAVYDGEIVVARDLMRIEW